MHQSVLAQLFLGTPLLPVLPLVVVRFCLLAVLVIIGLLPEAEDVGVPVESLGKLLQRRIAIIEELLELIAHIFLQLVPFKIKFLE